MLLSPATARAHNPFNLPAAQLTTAEPTLDGVMQPGEWASASTSVLPIGQVWAMHDGTYAYFAFRRIDASVGSFGAFQVYFDDAHDGALTAGDDTWSVGFTLTPVVGGSRNDAFWTPGPPSGFPDDVSDGGTLDTEGSGFYTAGTGEAVFEMRHPICSPELTHDICLTPGDPDVGITFLYFDSGETVTYPASFTDQANFGHFSLVAQAAVPETTIDSGPPDYSQSSSADFTFSSDQPAATFECSLDGAAFAACTSPQSYSSLTEGPHQLDVQATNGAEVDATPALYRWTVDTVPATGTLDQHNGRATSTTGGSTLGTAANNELAQIFSPVATGLVPEARVGLSCTSAVTTRIEATSGGVPNGTVLATATIAPGAGTASKRFQFSPAPTLAAGTSYALVVAAAGAPGCFTYVAEEAYPGAIAFRTGAGPWSLNTAEDLSFATFLAFEVVNSADTGAGSLRQAILDANANPGPDAVVFDVGAGGTQTIAPASALPPITEAVTIDGTTQPGAGTAPRIRVDGTNAGTADGIILDPDSSGSTIKGLMVVNFAGTGIVLGSDGNVVQANYVGTDGVNRMPNNNRGIIVDGVGNVVGGPLAADGNVIAGNGTLSAPTPPGIELLSDSNDTVIQNNRIGASPDGTSPILNSGAGISIVDSNGTEIRNNVISGNGSHGIEVLAPGQDGQGIFDNLIGPGTGGQALGNGGYGIFADGDFVLIGDDGSLPPSVATGGPNTIKFNSVGGVFVAAGSGGARIVTNSIGPNGGLGIDLAAGANDDQGAPTIETVEFVDADEVNILATFDALRLGAHRIDYYKNTSCDGSGAGEGEVHLASDLTSVAAAGPSSFDSTNVSPVSPGDIITATITGPGTDGDPGVPVSTSEFSVCFTVAEPGLVVTNTNDSGAGSLRQAIINANATAGADTIEFDIPTPAPYVISLNSSLPTLTDAVTIDGTTQPGWIGPPVIQIDGSQQDGGTGLEVAGGDSTIRGLMLTNMPNVSLNVLSDGNTVAGNYIGTDGFSGFESQTGVVIAGSSNLIGGTTALDRNVISGFNWVMEIQAQCFELGCVPGAIGNVVQGNYLGTNAAGNAALGNEYVGIQLDDASDTMIGGPGPGEGNVIAGTGYWAAIDVNSALGPTTIQGNLIGVAANGFGRVGNRGAGVRIEGADGVLVGGTGPGEGNEIAYNGEDSVDTGVAVDIGTGNSILGNSIHDNNGLGIAIATEENDNQAAPALEELLIGSGLTVNGRLDSTSDETFRLEFFDSKECDPSRFGEGDRFLGSMNVTTNDVGNASFTATLPAVGFQGVITATATNSGGSTSEFSACLEEGVPDGETEGVTLTSDERFANVGAKVVPLSSVPSNQLPSFAGSPSSAPVGSIPVGSIPVGSIPVGSIPVGSIPVGSIPVGSIPVGSIPVGSIPVGSIGLNAIPVGSIGLDQILLSMLPVDADALLAGTPLLDRPRQSITLADIYANATTRARFEALTLAQSGLAQSLLSGVPFAAFLLGSATLNQLPPPDAATWCAAIEAADGDCDGVSGTNTVMGLSIAGAPVGSIPVGSIPVGSIPVGSIPVGSIPVGSIDLEASRLAGIPVGSISNPALVVSCTAATCPTLGDAKRLNRILGSAQLKHLVGAFPPDLVLNDLIMGIVPRSALAWEGFPVDGFQLFDSSGIANTVHYRLRFTLQCSSPDFSVRVRLPEGWLYKTGTTKWQYGTTATPIAGAEPTTSAKAGARWATHPPNPCAGGVASRDIELTFQALSGFALGSEETTAWVTRGGTVEQATGEAPVLVTQNWENNNAPETAPTIGKDSLVFGHVASAGDKEIFRLPIPTVRGTRTTFYLSHIPEGADFDLVIGKPAAPPLQSNPVGSIPVGSIPIEDTGSSVDNSGTALPPETLQDIPVGSIPVGSISANRGTADEVAQVVADGEQGFYTIVVAGYNNSYSEEPFVLRIKQTPPPTLPPCQTRSLTLGAAGTLPASLPTTTKTLFLVNQQRLAALYPGQSVPNMLTAAASVASYAGVDGAILPVDGNQAVRNAYAAWDTDPCSIDRANNVIAAINAVVAGYRATLPNLKYVVLLGTDEALPMMRRLDPVTISNETDEAADLFFTTATPQGTRANALYAAAGLGYYLSDTAYGALTSIPWLGRDLYLPNLAVGRLVEGPLDIQRQLELYVAAGGQLTPATTLTTAYDFLSDGGDAVAAALAGVGSGPHTTLNNDTWTSTDLAGAFTQKATQDDVLSVNAHYSHWLLQPAAGPPLVSTGDLPALPTDPMVEPAFARRILFTMGCHAGLNVANTLLPNPTNVRFKDWAQSYGQQRAAVYVANTGFGYGDTEANALSERLMSIFAKKLAEGGVVGERWVDAVQEYFGTAGVYGVYDEKALTEATFYGLPFWTVPGDGPTAPPTLPSSTVSTPVDISIPEGDLTPHSSERGMFWDFDGESLAIHYRPIQPRVAHLLPNVPGKIATGALIKELRTEDVDNVDPWNATPTIDLMANEPERNFQQLIFPASPVSLTRSRGFAGERQHAVVIAGQFRPGEFGSLGTERFVRRIGLEVSYATSLTDPTPPLIEQVTALETASATIFVKASEDAPGGVTRVAALWSDGTLNPDLTTLKWNFEELTQSGAGWSAGPFPTAGPIQVIAMAQNANGLVAYSTNKGVNFPSVAGAGAPEILIESPAPDAEYFLNQQVPVSFACSSPAIVTSCVSTPAGNLLDTATVGPKTFSVTATDLAGGTAIEEVHYRVIYRFTGFFEPISNPPFMNQVKAGQAIPLRFSLAGNQGLDIFASGYPASKLIPCDTSAPVDPSVETSTAGSSGLTYVSSTDRYQYLWKTEKSWANTCRRLIFTFRDDKVRYLDFKFTK